LILVELRKVILVASQFFEFLHSQGQTRPGRAISISSHVRYATKSDDRLLNCDPSRWATTEVNRIEILNYGGGGFRF
jgi:hypothetical protein